MDPGVPPVSSIVILFSSHAPDVFRVFESISFEG